MDLSSELVHALLPLYLATVLGASMRVIGLIEGVAEATALVVKVFSGVLSDAFARRKPLVVLGYGLAAVTKLVFPLAPSLGWIVGARFVDRIGKGIRGAPRDALIADLAPAQLRGASFGLRQALDTVGGLGGPLLALAAMAWFAGSFTAAFWVAVVPAATAVALLVLGVDEPARAATPAAGKPRLAWRDVSRLPRDYWVVVGIAALLTLARFSEAFLVLRAQGSDLGVAGAPWVMVVMSAVYAAVAFPAGTAFDRGHGPRLLSLGLAALIAADLVLAAATAVPWVMAGAALWGLHMGLTQGLLAALVAAHAPADLRGSAFGVFNLAGGFALLVASVVAGGLWDAFGARWTFVAGAVFTALAWVALALHGTQALRRTG
ncbi:MAG: MFS transporter [Acidobacteria bacterium]|jgi:MFS family permease|nr:MFS transporter [Acidobacteriota bacterium]